MAVGRSKPSAVGGRLAVDREAGAGQRRRAQRAFVQPRPRVGEAAAVARQHLVIGHQMMAERHRLARLQMGEARHDRRGMLLGAVEQRVFERVDPRRAPRRSPSRTHSLKSVATWSLRERAVCSRPAAGPISSAEAMLDMHVDVLERRILGELAAPHIPRRSRRAPASIAAASSAEMMPCCAEHRGMGAARGDVLAPQPLVDGDRGIYLAHQLGRAAGEAPAPHRIGVACAADPAAPCAARARRLR